MTTYTSQLIPQILLIIQLRCRLFGAFHNIQSPTMRAMYDNTARKIPFIYVSGVPASELLLLEA